jgi:hypothetical protein
MPAFAGMTVKGAGGGFLFTKRTASLRFKI